MGQEAGLEVVGFEYGLGVLLSDLELDGDLDIFIANDTNPDRLYENVPWPGGASADPAGLGFRFEERAARAGVADPGSGMGVAGADYDGDGRSDLFVTNARRQTHGAFRSKPPDENDPSYDDVRDDLGPDLGRSTGWGVSWGDLDLDTDADLVLVNGKVPVTSPARTASASTRSRTWRRRAGRGSTPIGSDSMLGTIEPMLARGSAEADYDNDGDLDIAVGTLGGSLAFSRTTRHQATGSKSPPTASDRERRSLPHCPTASACGGRSAPGAATSRRRIRAPISASARPER